MLHGREVEHPLVQLGVEALVLRVEELEVMHGRVLQLQLLLVVVLVVVMVLL